MRFFAKHACSVSALLLLSAAAESSQSFPAAEDDSAARIRNDLETVGREYLALSNPSRTQMTTLSYKLEHLEKRCNRLGGERNPELKALLGVINEFKQALKQRALQEAKRRSTERKPYVFGAISGPTLREGGHSPKGMQYLAYEVGEFIKHYRRLKHDKFSNNEVYLKDSRSYFQRTIESSINTALRRIENPKPDNVVMISPSGGLVYDNYSPQQNLQWALYVSRIAQHFESQLSGSQTQWAQWQGKIRAVAAAHNIALE